MRDPDQAANVVMIRSVAIAERGGPMNIDSPDVARPSQHPGHNPVHAGSIQGASGGTDNSAAPRGAERGKIDVLCPSPLSHSSLASRLRDALKGSKDHKVRKACPGPPA